MITPDGGAGGRAASPYSGMSDSHLVEGTVEVEMSAARLLARGAFGPGTAVTPSVRQLVPA